MARLRRSSIRWRRRSCWAAPSWGGAAGTDPRPESRWAWPSRAGCSRGRRSRRRPAAGRRSRRCSPVWQCVLNTVRHSTVRGQLSQRLDQAIAQLGSAAVDKDQAVGRLEREDIGATARHQSQSIVQRNDAGLLGRGAAWQDQAAKQSADHSRQESPPVEHHSPVIIPKVECDTIRPRAERDTPCRHDIPGNRCTVSSTRS